MRRVLLDWLTGIDGKTHDPARAMLVVSVLAFIGYQGWAIYLKAAWDAQAFGIGISTILGAGAWGIKAKANTEPGCKNEG